MAHHDVIVLGGGSAGPTYTEAHEPVHDAALGDLVGGWARLDRICSTDGAGPPL